MAATRCFTRRRPSRRKRGGSCVAQVRQVSRVRPGPLARSTRLRCFSGGRLAINSAQGKTVNKGLALADGPRLLPRDHTDRCGFDALDLVSLHHPNSLPGPQLSVARGTMPTANHVASGSPDPLTDLSNYSLSRGAAGVEKEGAPYGTQRRSATSRSRGGASHGEHDGERAGACGRTAKSTQTAMTVKPQRALAVRQERSAAVRLPRRLAEEPGRAGTAVWRRLPTEVPRIL